MINLAIYRSGRLYFLAPAGLMSEDAILQRKSCFYSSQVLAVNALVEMTHDAAKEARDHTCGSSCAYCASQTHAGDERSMS